MSERGGGDDDAGCFFCGRIAGSREDRRKYKQKNENTDETIIVGAFASLSYFPRCVGWLAGYISGSEPRNSSRHFLGMSVSLTFFGSADLDSASLGLSQSTFTNSEFQ